MADTGNNRVVAIAPDGTQSVVIGSGLAAPADVATDGAGNLYVADTGNDRVVKQAPGGTPVVVASSLSRPQGVAVDTHGNVFVADTGNSRVLKVLPGGSRQQVGSNLVNPVAVAVDLLGDVFIVEGGSPTGGPGNKVVKVTPGEIQVTVGTSLVNPTGVTVDATGDVLVTTGLSTAGFPGVLSITPDGQQHFFFGPAYAPSGIATTPDGTLYIADAGSATVASKLYRSPGAAPDVPTIGIGTSIATGLSGASGVAVSATGTVASTYGRAVTLTASAFVTPTGRPRPTGSVTFSDGTTVLGTVPLSGAVPDQASLTVATLARGTHHLTAAYAPDAPTYVTASSGEAVVTVATAPTGTALAVAGGATLAGQPVTLDATVTADADVAPTGTVSFADGGTPIAGCESRPLVAGAAHCTTTGLAAGTRLLTATYAGDGNFSPSQSGSVALTLTAASPPGAPAAVIAFAGDSTASVGWTAPSTVLPITRYTLVPSPACPACTGLTTTGTTSTVVAGLTNGTAYTFAVRATSAAGDGPLSPASDPVTPTASTGSGALLTWGTNGSGQLGDGTTTASNVPVAASVPAGTSVTQVVFGGASTSQFGLARTSTGQVLAWGYNGQGQLGDGTTTTRPTPAPVNLPSGALATAVAAGWDFSLALTADGRVLAWGSRDGDGTFSGSPSPVYVPLPAGVTAAGVAATGQAAVILTTAGGVYTFGYGGQGELGNGATIPQLSGSPVAVSLPAGVTATAVSAGWYHVLALTSTGSVYAWGNNFTGTLGNVALDGPGWGTVSGTTVDCTPDTDRSGVPVLADKLAGLDVRQVAAGGVFSAALTDTGVVTWGRNESGDLGTGSATAATACYPDVQPVAFPTGVTVTSVVAGYHHALALGSTGVLYGWGSNSDGQLGNTDPAYASRAAAPVPVGLPGGTVVSAMGAAYSNSAAIAPSGVPAFTPAISLVFPNTAPPGSTVTVSGTYLAGAAVTFGSTPAPATCSATSCTVTVPAGSGVVDVAATTAAGASPPAVAAHFVFPTSGMVLNWGLSLSNALGAIVPRSGSLASANRPTAPLLPAGTRAVAVADGVNAGAAIASTGELYAWGANGSGQLGDGTTTDRIAAVPVALPDGVTATSVALGLGFGLASGSDGRVYAWGANSNGQLGDGTTTNRPAPGVVSGLPAGITVSRVLASVFTAGVLTSDGRLFTWGGNFHGALGTGSTAAYETAPAQVSVAAVTDADLGANSGLLLDAGGTLRSWGDNFYGQLGTGTADDSSPTPAAVPIPAGHGAVRAISLNRSAIVLMGDGSVFTWGDNTYGQLGSGSTAGESGTPGAVTVPAGAPLVAVSAGDAGDMALTSTGEVWAWGDNSKGELAGATTATKSAVPLAVPLPGGTPAAAVQAGDFINMAITGLPVGGSGVTSVSPAAGAAGATVTVAGAGLTGGSVWFGAVQAASSTCTATACTATVPAGSGTVDVTVHVGTLVTAASTASRFRYFGPVARLTLTPAAATVAPGTAQPYAVEAFDADGDDLGPAAGAVLSVSPDGTCTAGSCTPAVPGPHTVVATVAGVTATATLQASVTPTSAATTVSTGGTSVTGQPVTFTTTVHPATGTGVPTGTVAFTEFGNPVLGCGAVTLASGQASCTVAFTFPMAHPVVAAYSGDGLYAPSVAPAAVDVSSPASTAVAVGSSPTAPVAGQAVVLTATVAPVAPGAGVPTGTVAFADGGGPIAACAAQPVNGSGAAQCTVVYPSAGHRSVTASYGGDGLYEPSASPPSAVDVGRAGTATTVAGPSSAVTGQPVTFTASVAVAAPGAGTPGGTVAFTVDGAPSAACGAQPLAPAAGGAVATCTLAFTTTGPHTVAAAYGGDASFTGSTAGPAAIQVDRAATRVLAGVSGSPNVVAGQPVTLTADVSAVAPGSGQPGGTVTFTAGGTTLCTAALSAGRASCPATFAVPGQYTVDATFGGSAAYLGSSSGPATAVSVSQAPSVTTLTASTAAPVIGQPVTFTATVTVPAPGAGTLTGTVQFLDGSTPVGGCTAVPLAAGGTATCTVSYPAAGGHSVTARYSGNGSFLSSTSAAVAVTVGKGSVNVTVAVPATSVFGQPVTIGVGVVPVSPAVGTPTGSVTVNDGANLVCTLLLSGGSASCTAALGAVGDHSLVATYSGDPAYDAATSPAAASSVTRAATTTALAASATAPVVGQPVVYTATVRVTAPGAGTPGATVAFRDGLTAITGCDARPVAADGTATCTVTYAGTGTHSVTATYAGDPSLAGSGSSAVAVTVARATSTVALAASTTTPLFGRSVTFTATVAVTAPGAAATTGTVTFFDGTTALATVAVSGSTASFTTAGLAPGAHAVTARYSGTAGLAGSTSAARTVTVGFSSPCITTASSKALTVESGQAACVGAGGTVKSSVTVKQGGSLYVSGGSITGSVTTTGATAVTICKATVGGSISVFGSTGFVLIGDGTSACGANTLKSYLTAASNTGGIEVAGNTFSGPVTLTNNSGSGPLPGQRIPIVRANTITGNLSCTGNVPGVDDVGNKASSYSGQCTLTGTSVSVAASPSGGTVATGQPVTFTATLAFTGSTVPTGTVSFTDGGAPLAGCASVPVSARTAGSTTVYSAACTVTWTDSGYHSVTAAYSGDTRLAPSVSAVPVAVTVA